MRRSYLERTQDAHVRIPDVSVLVRRGHAMRVSRTDPKSRFASPPESPSNGERSIQRPPSGSSSSRPSRFAWLGLACVSPGYNQLTGAVPASLGQLRQLFDLELQNNYVRVALTQPRPPHHGRAHAQHADDAPRPRGSGTQLRDPGETRCTVPLWRSGPLLP